MTERPSSRNVTLDIAKGIAMLLVLYGHALGVFLIYDPKVRELVFTQLKPIYSFHMPLFFMLSGMVFRAKPLRQTLRNALALVFTAYMVHALCWLADTAVSRNSPDVLALAMPLVELRAFCAVIVWFLPALALVQLLYYLLVTSDWPVRLLVLLLATLAFVWAQNRASNVLQFSSVLPGLSFYTAGHLIRQAGRSRLASWRWPAVPVLCLVAAVATSYLNGGCSTDIEGRCGNIPGGFIALMMAGQYGYLPLFMLTALLGSVAVLGVAELIELRVPLFARTLVWIGRHTLQLMVINGLVIFFFHPVLLVLLRMPGGVFAEIFSVGLVVFQIGVAAVFGSFIATPMQFAGFLADKAVGVVFR